MSFPKEFLHRLRTEADIVQIIGERVALKKRGNEHTGLCPFHSEKTPSFTVSAAKNFYHCFGCGANGDALAFILKTQANGDFVAAVKLLAGRLGIAIPADAKEGKESPQIHAALAAAAKHYHRAFVASPVAQKIAADRGWNADTAAQFKIGYAAPGWNNIAKALPDFPPDTLIKAGLLRQRENDTYDYFRNRLLFPIQSGGQVVGFGGRALDADDPAKYLNTPETAAFSKKRELFGMNLARAAAADKKRIIVAEGYADVVQLAQAGFAESVAAMGTAVSLAQARKIAAAAANIFFAMDGDDAGRAAAVKSLAAILPQLADGQSVHFVFLPKGEDPDSFIREKGAAEFEYLAGGRPAPRRIHCATLARPPVPARRPRCAPRRLFTGGRKVNPPAGRRQSPVYARHSHRPHRQKRRCRRQNCGGGGRKARFSRPAAAAVRPRQGDIQNAAGPALLHFVLFGGAAGAHQRHKALFRAPRRR